MDIVHGVPVPERFLPHVYRALAEAYGREATTEVGESQPPEQPPLEGGDGTVWTREEVAHVYREAKPALRDLLDYLADPDREGQPVKTSELASALYPDLSEVDARGKLYGTLGNVGRWASYFNKGKWFIIPERERHPDGSEGYFTYTMPPHVAEWVRKARER